MPRASQKGVCFVIAPIGEERSETRTRSDQVLRHVIAPAANECGYRALRADRISEPGIITSQVIQHLVDDPLVIADLTDWNPNVFYELAVRHAVRKPVVQIIQAGQNIPFDVAGTRTIPLDHRDLDSVEQCRRHIVRQVQAVEKDASQVDTPISVAMDLQSLRRSDNPLEKSIAQIMSGFQRLEGQVAAVTGLALRGPGLDPDIFAEVVNALRELDSHLALKRGERPTKRQLQEARASLRHAARLALNLAPPSNLAPWLSRYFRPPRHQPSEADEEGGA
jgi:hypothetical protein